MFASRAWFSRQNVHEGIGSLVRSPRRVLNEGEDAKILSQRYVLRCFGMVLSVINKFGYSVPV